MRIYQRRVGQRGEYNPLYREPHFNRAAENRCDSQTVAENCRAMHGKTVSARRLNGSQCWLMRLPDSWVLKASRSWEEVATCLEKLHPICFPEDSGASASCARGSQESSATASAEFSGSVWRGFSHAAERLRF